MNDTYSIESLDGATMIRLTRELSVPELMEVMDQVAAVDQCDRRRLVVTKHFKFTTPEIQRITLHGRLCWPAPSRVSYVAGDDLGYGLLRMLEVHREQRDYHTSVFRTPQQALPWLARKED